MKELEKMLAGQWYDGNYCEDLLVLRQEAEQLCWQYNQCNPVDFAQKTAILAKLLPHAAKDVIILQNFYTDYGWNCYIGEACFFNHGAYLMDGAKITIGDHCFFGPNCGFYTASHPLDVKARNAGYEKALPITIGNNVWFGGNVIVLPGVHIGDNCVIGAGSVVTKDIPANYLALGNPCRPIRLIEEDEKALEAIRSQPQS